MVRLCIKLLALLTVHTDESHNHIDLDIFSTCRDTTDIETLQLWLDEFLDADCTNEVLEVGSTSPTVSLPGMKLGFYFLQDAQGLRRMSQKAYELCVLDDSMCCWHAGAGGLRIWDFSGADTIADSRKGWLHFSIVCEDSSLCPRKLRCTVLISVHEQSFSVVNF